MADLSGRGVQVLLIGTETHSGPFLSTVPTVGRTITALADQLSQRCGVALGQLHQLHDPEDAYTIAQAVIEVTQKASAVLLIYYVGHGLRGPDEQLYLAAKGTDRLTPGLAAHQAYPFSQLRQALSTCRASSIVVILDCCFSGRAQLDAATAGSIVELPPVHGVYLLASAEQLALAGESQEYTVFSGALIDLLSRGDPGGGPLLTLDDAYHHLFETLRKQDAPLPHRQEGGRSGQLVLSANPAYRALLNEDGGPVAQAEGPSPYRGLNPFREQDAHVFFGRRATTETLIAEVAQRLSDPALLMLLGPSGSGKSSLLHAGLLAGVRRDGLVSVSSDADREPIWPRVLPVLTPGGTPMVALARALASDDRDLAGRLQEDPQLVVELADQLAPTPLKRPLLLIVDQMEELFTICESPGARTAFLAALSALAAPRSEGGPRAIVVAALRSDFYGAASQDSTFARLLSGPQVVVQQLTAEELQQAVKGPASRAGLHIGDGLAELLLHELGVGRPNGPEPGVLPLLSHVLWETWRNRVGTRLTVDGYRSSGGLNGALTKTAEDLYGRLDESEQRVTRQLLLRLVRVGADGIDTARPVVRDELLHGLGKVAPVVLERLATQRLVSISPENVVRVSHETLLSAWPRLHRWIQEDRTRITVRQQLADAAQAWQAGGRDRGDLMSGARLAMTRNALSSPEPDQLTQLEGQFLVLSSRQQRIRRSLAVLAVVLVVLLGAGVMVILQQRAETARMNAQAESRRLVVQAEALRATRPDAALALSMTAYRTAATPEAIEALYTSYATPTPVLLVGHTKPVVNLAYTPDGHTLVSSSADNTVRLWDVSNPRRPAPRAVIQRAATTAVAVSPDGRLVVGGSPTALALWDISDPARPVTLADLTLDRSTTFSVAFSADGKLVATAGSAGKIRIWDVQDARRPMLVSERSIGAVDVSSVAFSPDGRTLATAHAIPQGQTEGGMVRLWDIGDVRHSIQLVEISMKSATTVAFSPDAKTLVAGGTLGVFKVWDVVDPRNPQEKSDDWSTSQSVTGSTYSVAFRSDSKHVAIAGTTGEVTIVSVDGEVREKVTLSGVDPSRSVEFRPDGRGLANGTDAGTIRVWSLAVPLVGGDPSGSITFTNPGSIFGGSEGRLLVTQAVEGSGAGVRLWDISADPPLQVGHLPMEFLRATFLPDGATMIGWGVDGKTIRLWDVREPGNPVPGGTLIRGGPPGGYFNLVARPDGNLIAANNSEEKTIRLFGIRDYRAVAEIVQFDHSEPVRQLWFLDDHILAVWGVNDLVLWDVRDPMKPVRAGTLDDAAPRTNILYSRSSGVALITERGPEISQPIVQMWDLSDPYRPRRAGHMPAASMLSSPIFVGEDTVVLASSSGVMETWDISNIDDPTPGPALISDGSLNSLELSLDRQALAGSGSFLSSRFQLWRREVPGGDFAPFAALTGNSPKFSFDSELIIADLSISSPLNIFGPDSLNGIVWDLDPERIYGQMCESPPKSLGGAEWKRYFPGMKHRDPCS